MTNTTKRPNQKKLVADWNKRYPAATEVEYWTGSHEGAGKRTTTNTEAMLLGGHTAVVWLVGVPSCVALSHVRPVTK